MMLVLTLLGLVGLSWAAAGMAMIAMPAWWHDRLRSAMTDPLPRFLLTQGMILGGLTLILGTSAQQGYWWWVALGSLLVAKALILLGAPEPLRERLLNWWRRSPAWVLRVAGVALMALAALLVIDVLRGGP